MTTANAATHSEIDTGLENSGLLAHMLVDGRRIRVTLEVMDVEESRHDGL